MTHAELCVRAKRWLRGTRRCHPVLSDCASVREIPDAIGWSSSYKWYGSTVVECKTSVADFYRDKRKRFAWSHIEHGWIYKASRISQREAEEQGYQKVDVPLMGDYRFYMCEPEILSLDLVKMHAPDHGLLYVEGKSVRIVRSAPKRTLINKDGEIRFLRFAIINSKKPYEESI